MSRKSNWRIWDPPIHYPLDSLAAAFPFPGNARNQKKTKHLTIIYRFSINSLKRVVEIVDRLRTFLPIHCRGIATCKTELKAGPESTNKLVFAFDRRHAKRDHQNRAGKATCLSRNPSYNFVHLLINPWGLFLFPAYEGLFPVNTYGMWMPNAWCAREVTLHAT